ncbi:hypothetical protein [Collinsella ureilytica]|uniref:hypothetical protein n=1 Tax=Collinsella ureilytica TaxID=2869515 RepID=UPI00352E5F10
MKDHSESTDKVSLELDTMVQDMLNHMLDALAEGEWDGVILCYEDAQANRYDATFTEDGLEACLSAAERMVVHDAGSTPSQGIGKIVRYAIAYVGMVQDGDTYQDAILVSFYERGQKSGYSAYLPIANIGEGDRFVWGDPLPAGAEDPLI